MKKVLILSSVTSIIEQFNMSNIKLLLQLGCQVEVACNFVEGSTYSREKAEEFKEVLTQKKIAYYQIDFSRNVYNLQKDIKAYRQVLELAQKQKYDFVHCHSPIGGVIGRLVAHKLGIPIIYTAHGFHFYKGAPFKNWLFYYPIEKVLSHFTNILISINLEDYFLASQKFHAKKTVYIPGVGIDTNNYLLQENNHYCKLKKELQISNNTIVLLSIGELSKRKNHIVVLRMLAALNMPNIKYFICGMGKLEKELRCSAQALNIENQVVFLGYREDIADLCNIADIFIFPSLQEGLPVALMEAMAAGLPVICSKIRGNVDLIEENKGGFLVESNDIKEYQKKLELLISSKDKRIEMGRINQKNSLKYDLKMIEKQMYELYKTALY